VVPIVGPDGVVGEIDIDSDWLDAFDERDRDLLEDVAGRLSRVMRSA
jgi:putative methionine-R-sulfoxide reductase with GAF domain